VRKIVFLTDQPLDQRNYDRFGLQAWIDRNWAVEAWDLTPWAHRQVWRSFKSFGNELKQFSGYFQISSARELSQRLSSSGQIDYFIDLTNENYQTVRAKIALDRSGAIRIVCAAGSIPVPDRAEIGLARKLAQTLAKGPAGALKWLSHAFFQKIVAPRIATGVTIVSGERSVAAVRGRPQIIKTHNFDYDIYLGLSKSARTPGGRYVVFVDQDYCFHPEYLYQSIRSIASPERYFPAIRDVLERISIALGLEVRVAAHPRATYQQRGLDCFGQFSIEYGKTAELIKYCEAVVCHDSTAIQFAVLFGKPLIFVTTDELACSYEGRSIEKVAAELGKSPINLDRADLASVDWNKELDMDAGLYARFRRTYIKTDGSPELPLWDIVIDHIENAANQGA
jgi:hypothetical protein